VSSATLVRAARSESRIRCSQLAIRALRAWWHEPRTANPRTAIEFRMAAKPPTNVSLVWEHDLVFGGRSGDVEITLDSASHAGPSPVQALAFALASCMAMDVVHVLKKGRCDFRGLRVDLIGERAN